MERMAVPDSFVSTPTELAQRLFVEKTIKTVEDDYKKSGQALDWRIAAFKRDESPVQKLSLAEQSLADKSVQHVKELVKGLNGPQVTEEDMMMGKDPVGQAQLDLAQDLSCLSHQDLQKILPSINAALEPSGLRLAEVPENKELYIGMRSPAGNWVPSTFATGLVGCKRK